MTYGGGTPKIPRSLSNLIGTATAPLGTVAGVYVGIG